MEVISKLQTYDLNLLKLPCKKRIVAPLAELVDARDSKSRSRKGVPVRFWRGAPYFLLSKLAKDDGGCINIKVRVT
jgi:hypothetical protein